MNKFPMNIMKWFYSSTNVSIMTVDKDEKSFNIIFYVSNINLLVEEFKKEFLKNMKMDNKVFLLFDEGKVHKIEFRKLTDYTCKKHDYIFEKNNHFSNNIESEEKDELPIPTHLTKIFMPLRAKSTKNKIHGFLRCNCNNENFRIKFNDYEEYNDNGHYIICICNNCQQEFLIFDSFVHGWDGYVCNNHIKRLDIPKLSYFTCDCCESNIFNVQLMISSQGKEDFCEELYSEISMGDFTSDEWVNAFDRITIYPNCKKCNKTFNTFFDYETM